ncbi:MAG: MoxR family ATPase [Acidobacteriota bacterium]
MTQSLASSLSAAEAARHAERLVAALDRHVLGQRQAAELMVAAYLAGGHVLLEGIPGLGKTLLARAFAAALGLEFQRVQFTPDLMPADVLGTNVYQAATQEFRLVRGPIFTQILMADEINRTPPKTQSALLEAMQEAQVTIDGDRHRLDAGFFVVATQNPIELEGTYPLPEAQLDRFLLRVDLSLPPMAAEVELYRRAVSGQAWGHDDLPAAVVAPEVASALRRASRAVHVSDPLLDYLARLAAGIRASERLELAISPRGALALLETARAMALLEGRDFAIPDDFKRCLIPCWRHRLILDAESELEGRSARDLLDELAAAVEVPHGAQEAQPEGPTAKEFAEAGPTP